MGRKKISAHKEIDIANLFDYKLQDVSLPSSLDPVAYPKMTLNTIKAWFLFLSMVEETTAEEAGKRIIAYTFPALDFAKRMNMNQPRGSEVRKALIPLTKINFSAIDGDSADVESVRALDTNLLMAVEYEGRSPGKPIIAYLHPEVNTAIYEAKKAICFDYDDIAKLTSLNSIHSFTALTRLRDRGISQLTVEEFRTAIGIGDKYSNFRDLKRYVLTPVQEDISSNTTFHSFRFYYDGKLESPGKGKTVKYIGFSFDDPIPINDAPVSFSDYLSPEDAERVLQTSTLTQQIILELCKKQYAVSQYLNLIMKSITDSSEADFRVCCEKILLEAGGRPLSGKYGKILTSELKKIKKTRPAKKTPKTVDVNRMAYIDQHKWLKSYQERAKALVKTMPANYRKKIVEDNLPEIKLQSNDASKFDERDIMGLSLDCRKTAVRALITFLANQYYTGKRRIEEDMRWESGSLFDM